MKVGGDMKHSNLSVGNFVPNKENINLNVLYKLVLNGIFREAN